MNADLQQTIDQCNILLYPHFHKTLTSSLVKTLESQAGVEAQKELLNSLKQIRASLAQSLGQVNSQISQQGGNNNSGDTKIYKQLVKFR